MTKTEITIGELTEIATIHKLDDELFPIFSIAAFKCTQLIPGTCKRIYNSKTPGDDLLALKNYDETMIVMFYREGHVDSPGIYANPIDDINAPSILYGINISKYLL